MTRIGIEIGGTKQQLVAVMQRETSSIDAALVWTPKAAGQSSENELQRN